MNHAVVTEHLADYLEGDLALDLRALVDAHLDGCPLCASEVREMQQTIRLLRALPEPAHPPLIAANVMRRIRAGETEPSFFERVQRALGAVLEPSFVLPASAIAVAALVIMVVQGGGPLTPEFLATGERMAPAALPTAAPTRSAEALPSARPRPALEAAELVASEELDRSFGASAARELGTPMEQATAETSDASGLASNAAVERAMDSESAAVNRAAAPRMAQAEAMDQGGWGDARSNGGGRSYFVDPGLVQGFASEVSGPGASAPTNRIEEMGGAVPLSLSRRVPMDGPTLGGVSESSGEDPRDVWLARALEHPADFSHFIAQHNLAEQELWVERLSERAEARGLLGELIAALRGAGDEKASFLAEDFAAAAQAPTATSGTDETRSGTPSPSVHAP